MPKRFCLVDGEVLHRVGRGLLQVVVGGRGNGQHGALAYDQVLRYRVLGLLLGQKSPVSSASSDDGAITRLVTVTKRATTWGFRSYTRPVQALSFQFHAIHH